VKFLELVGLCFCVWGGGGGGESGGACIHVVLWLFCDGERL